MKNCRMLVLCLAAFVLVPALSAHGVRITRMEKENTVVFQAAYDGAEPMAFASVIILGPGDPPVEFQSGWTDARGRFAFVPNGPGRWRVSVDDGMGHRAEEVFSLTEALFEKDKKKTETESGEKIPLIKPDRMSRIPLFLRIVIGLCLIFGITGIFYWIKARRLVRGGKGKGSKKS